MHLPGCSETSPAGMDFDIAHSLDESGPVFLLVFEVYCVLLTFGGRR